MREQNYTINRRLIVLLPKQPALDWLISVEPADAATFTLAKIREDQDCYLVPVDVKSLESARRWANRRWDMLLTKFLNSWHTDQTLWPRKRSLKMFQEWFEIEYHSAVWDMGDSPIDQESWG